MIFKGSYLISRKLLVSPMNGNARKWLQGKIIKPDLMSGELERAMTLVFHAAPRARRLRIVLDWLSEAKAAITRPAAGISGMSEKDLRDIGLTPRTLRSSVYREIGKPGLVDFSWRLGR